jgi:hypothetical protein
VIAISLAALFLAALTGAPALAHTRNASLLSQVRKLYTEKRYTEIARLPCPGPEAAPDLDYYRGMAFAKLSRWTDAWNAFRQGEIKAPRDERFPVELAGVDFEKKNLRRAKAELHRALRIDPKDAYSNNFLASLYYLDGNLTAALKYWNRASKPKIRRVQVDPQPRLNLKILKNAMAFEPGAILTLPEFDASVKRLQGLGVFPEFRYDLIHASNDAYDVVLHPAEVNGWGNGTPEALLSLLRGVPYDSVYPAVMNIHGSATNLISLLRWDPNKQRVFAALSGPIAASARTRYQFYLDARKENWNLNPVFSKLTEAATAFQMRKAEGGAEILSVVNDRLALRSGIDLSGRSFSHFASAPGVEIPFFKNGFSLEAETSASYRLAEIPDRRLTLDSAGSVQFGHAFATGLGNFVQTEGGLAADWLPQASGDDYEMTARFRTGRTFGEVPFDDLFMLGLERDNDLWLRGHIGTAAGRKGSAPMGRDYTLTNWDEDKVIYHNGFFQVRLGPFLDSGRITDPTGAFGSKGWMWDTGLELKVRVVGGTEVALFFGKDLLAGHTSLYATTLGALNGPFPPGPAPFRGY